MKKSNSAKTEIKGNLQFRYDAAKQVPFFLRKWWLRDFRLEAIQQEKNVDAALADHDLAPGSLFSDNDSLCDLSQAQYLEDR